MLREIVQIANGGIDSSSPRIVNRRPTGLDTKGEFYERGNGPALGVLGDAFSSMLHALTVALRRVAPVVTS